MLSILHASDVHFGRRHHRPGAEAFLRLAHEREHDLIVVSGDLTQRAKVREFEEARAFLGELPEGTPRVVTVGNHDVPLYRVFERLFAPFRNYRRFISPQLDTVHDVPGARVVALNSATAYRGIINGNLTKAQLDFAEAAFADVPGNPVRILVTHHNLVTPGGREPDDALPGADRIARALHRMGVDLVLGGHLHRAFTATSVDALRPAESLPGALLVHSGTTSSTRGRGREKGRNTCNLIRIGREAIEVEPHVLLPSEGAFVPMAELRFPRPLGRLAPLPRVRRVPGPVPTG